jgi:hypothetical protein
MSVQYTPGPLTGEVPYDLCMYQSMLTVATIVDDTIFETSIICATEIKRASMCLSEHFLLDYPYMLKDIGRYVPTYANTHV